MNLENNLLWIILGENDYGYNDGEIVGYPVSTAVTHLEYLHKFYDENKIELASTENDVIYAKKLADLGMAIFINSGRPVDGKFYGTWVLPESLTSNQIGTFENLRPLFNEKYDPDIFASIVVTNNPTGYKQTITGCRDLDIESIIDRSNIKNGIDLLYKEIELQKESYKHKVQ